MSDKIPVKLSGVPETLLMTLNVRASETLRPGGLCKDENAVAILRQLDVDLHRLQMHGHDVIAVIMRMRKFDEYASSFMARNPGCTVVHVGCGLDTRYERVDDGQVEWFDLDLPEVIQLRRQVLPPDTPLHHTLTASALDEGWMVQVAATKPQAVLFISEGVLPYFTGDQVKTLVTRILKHFPGSEFVCDIHSPFVVWADNIHLVIAGVEARLRWGMKDAREMETWGRGIRLLEAWNYYENEDPLMKNYRCLRFIPGLAHSVGIYHYQLGGT